MTHQLYLQLFLVKKIDIENWCKHIDLFKKEKYGYTREEFNNITGGLFDK